jgi:uncharacterized membrane protein YuzA (DUF378 family)
MSRGVIPLNLALSSIVGNNSPLTPIFFIARLIAIAVWCGLFFWKASKKRKKDKTHSIFPN